MEKKSNEKRLGGRLLVIAARLLAVIAAILLMICVFSDREPAILLPIALGCTVAANLMLLLRSRARRNGED